MAPVAVGPSAATSQPASQSVANQTQIQPVTLGQRPTPAQDALAAAKSPELHGWKKVLDIIGQVGFPEIETAIPGTPGNYLSRKLPLLRGAAENEIKSTNAYQAGQKSDADIQRDQAEVRNLDDEIQNRNNPKTKPRAVIIQGPDGDPIPAIQNMVTNEITDQNGTPIPNAKIWEKTPVAKDEKFMGLSLPDVQAEIKSNPAQYPNGDIYSNRKKAAESLMTAEANAKRAPKDNSARDENRSDRNYQFNVKELDTERKPLEATMQKISAGMSNINLNSAQADAFLAPQILTLSAGGAGSGLRMNEAEINRVLAGRTTWEAIQAAANKYRLDPQHAQIPVEQRQAMKDILDAAMQKGTLKSSVISWADQQLINNDDVKAQRTAVATARQLLTAIDEGKKVQRNKKTGEFRVAPE